MNKNELLVILATIDRACVGEDRAYVNEPLDPHKVVQHVQEALAKRDTIIHRFKEWVDKTVTQLGSERSTQHVENHLPRH